MGAVPLVYMCLGGCTCVQEVPAQDSPSELVRCSVLQGTRSGMYVRFEIGTKRLSDAVWCTANGGRGASLMLLMGDWRRALSMISVSGTQHKRSAGHGMAAIFNLRHCPSVCRALHGWSGLSSAHICKCKSKRRSLFVGQIIPPSSGSQSEVCTSARVVDEMRVLSSFVVCLSLRGVREQHSTPGLSGGWCGAVFGKGQFWRRVPLGPGRPVVPGGGCARKGSGLDHGQPNRGPQPQSGGEPRTPADEWMRTPKRDATPSHNSGSEQEYSKRNCRERLLAQTWSH